MDITKFLDLILNKSIYFRRVDKFEDPYEGYVSSAYKEELSARYDAIQSQFNFSKENTDRLHQTHLNGLELVPLYAYANCWYIGDVESAAMWKLYGQVNNCVAICSTIYDLQLALDKSDNDEGIVYLEEVDYVDESSAVNAENFLKPMFEKRLSFAYENEFRALFLLNKGRTLLNSGIHQPKKQDVHNKDGVNLNVDVNQLINSIYISPTADAHFHSIVERIVDLAGFDGIECIQSELYKLK
ncbi:hypothetical protein [uncultured Acinetobacter sp.]|uniref:hypothetical protein n=1 Tax=uncultured Acinetobacter sp. TaxID=165433 RepID=UPI002583228D|nr:hypothetical protein [uncultured Acinetobacter sp.]